MASIEIKHEFSFPVETIFSAFTDKNKFESFFFRTDTGLLIQSELTPEVGGAFTIVEKRGDLTAAHYGTFLEFEPNEKISFVFAIGEGAEQTNYVDIEFHSRGASSSEINIKTDIAEPEMVDKSKLGWTKILQGLEKFLSKGAQSGVLSPTKDSQGNVIDNDDVVRVIKDLTVKGSSLVVKRGTIVKRVRLIPGNNEEVDCKVEGVGLRLETQWLLKS